ncbi:FlxA-like family protein [Paenibacillus terrigena]|uniref:FlxA-like family protein n=1 Tax=Paenibacillus terrigena TaxID=369333 RepID=UPI000365DE9F|nr:FlxA-like family protein [Paenibacillus terrigena]
MPRGRKVRRIDYGRKEMMELSEINIPKTFTNYMDKFYELYGFEESDFRVGKSENADYYFPADFAELLALILRNSSKHPFSRVNHVKEKINASQIQEYNQLMCENIDNELPSVFRDLIYTMPSHLQSVMLGDLTSVLVERLTLFIVNITKLDHQGMGDTVDWLCRRLDEANYNLFRGNYINEMAQKSNEAYNNEHFKELIEKLHGPKDEQIDDLERRMVATNNSIDYTISLLIKRILQATDDLYYADKGSEFLDLKNKELLLMLGLEAVPADESNSGGQHSHLIERTLYYSHELSKVVNRGRVAMAESVLEKHREKMLTRKSIVEQIKDKSFREPGELSVDEKKKILESRIKLMQDELARLEEEASEPQDDSVDSFMVEMQREYVAYCEKANQDSENLKPIVDHFVGQVLINFMNTSGIK